MKILLSFLLFILCTQVNNAQPMADFSQGNPEQWERDIRDCSPQILDVRTEQEYRSGHIPDALQANWNNMKEFTERVQHLDKYRPVYVYCLAGSRSTAAAAWLRSHGFYDVTELRGGINAWKREGKPLNGISNEVSLTPEQYLASIPANKMVLVDVGAGWCPPCVRMAPVIEQLEKDPSLQFVLLKIDAGVHTEVLKYLDIKPIPVFIVYRNGNEVWRKQGIVSAEELGAQLSVRPD